MGSVLGDPGSNESSGSGRDFLDEGSPQVHIEANVQQLFTVPRGSFVESFAIPCHLELRFKGGMAWASWLYHSTVFSISRLVVQSTFHYNIATHSTEQVGLVLPSQAWLVPGASPTMEPFRFGHMPTSQGGGKYAEKECPF